MASFPKVCSGPTGVPTAGVHGAHPAVSPRVVLDEIGVDISTGVRDLGLFWELPSGVRQEVHRGPFSSSSLDGLGAPEQDALARRGERGGDGRSRGQAGCTLAVSYVLPPQREHDHVVYGGAVLYEVPGRAEHGPRGVVATPIHDRFASRSG